MDIHDAVKMMLASAAGTDPETGEAFLADAVYRKPNVVKARNRALSALLKQEKREGFKPTKIGGYWSRRGDRKRYLTKCTRDSAFRKSPGATTEA